MIRKKICYLLYCLIGTRLPNSSRGISFGSAVRRGLAKGFIKSCGKNVNIQRKATISFDLCIGDNSGIGMRSVIGSGTTIGKDVMMGPECIIYTRNHAHQRTDVPMIRQGYEEHRPVVIEDDVWIGSRVTILPGVHIGQGCIIGAGAVVTKSVPPYCIAAGNPARVVKTRERDPETDENDLPKNDRSVDDR